MADGSREEWSSPAKCPRCGGSLVQDYQRFELICSECGLVVRDDIMDRGPEWHSYDGEEEDRSRGGSPVTEELHDRGVGMTLGPPTRDGRGKLLPPERRTDLQRQRKWQYRASVAGKRGLKEGLDLARTVRSRLGVPEGISQRAYRIYRLASDGGLVRGRSRDAFVAAAFDVACREASIPRELKDFADCLDIDVSKAKNAEKVLGAGLSLAPPHPGLSRRVCELLDRMFFLEDSVKDEVRGLVSEVEDRGLSPGRSGRDPNAFAAALLYLAFKRAGDFKSQKRLAELAGVSRTAVQDSVRDIEEAL